MNLADLTVVIGLSRGYHKLLRVSLASIPAKVKKLISWYGPGAPDRLPPNTRLLRPARHIDNFARGYVLNVAVKAVDTPYVLLADADMVFPTFFFRILEPALDRVLRFYVGRLTQAASEQVLRGTPWETLYADYQGQFNRVFHLVYGANNPCLYATQALHELRGYDERMIGWGKEDDDLTERTRRLGIRSLRVPVLVGCLYDKEINDYATYQRGVASQENIAILESRERVAANPDGWGDTPG